MYVCMYVMDACMYACMHICTYVCMHGMHRMYVLYVVYAMYAMYVNTVCNVCNVCSVCKKIGFSRFCSCSVFSFRNGLASIWAVRLLRGIFVRLSLFHLLSARPATNWDAKHPENHVAACFHDSFTNQKLCKQEISCLQQHASFEKTVLRTCEKAALRKWSAPIFFNTVPLLPCPLCNATASAQSFQTRNCISSIVSSVWPLSTSLFLGTFFSFHFFS